MHDRRGARRRELASARQRDTHHTKETHTTPQRHTPHQRDTHYTKETRTTPKRHTTPHQMLATYSPALRHCTHTYTLSLSLSIHIHTYIPTYIHTRTHTPAYAPPHNGMLLTAHSTTHPHNAPNTRAPFPCCTNSQGGGYRERGTEESRRKSGR